MKSEISLPDFCVPNSCIFYEIFCTCVSTYMFSIQLFHCFDYFNTQNRTLDINQLAFFT